MWAYTRITVEDLDTLRGADPDNFDTLVERLAADTPTVVAFGDESRGLTLSVLLANVVGYPSFLHGMRAALSKACDEIDAMLARFMTN